MGEDYDFTLLESACRLTGAEKLEKLFVKCPKYVNYSVAD